MKLAKRGDKAVVLDMGESEKKKVSSEKPPQQSSRPAKGTKYWGYIARIVFVVVVAVCFSRREAIKAFFSKLSQGQTTNEDIPDVQPLRPPEPDYYNPPFDPENPPEPIFSKSGVKMITKNELAAHGHSGPLKPIWLAMVGQVFDVDKGAKDYYGPEGGYKFFTGQCALCVCACVCVREKRYFKCISKRLWLTSMICSLWSIRT